MRTTAVYFLIQPIIYRICGVKVGVPAFTCDKSEGVNLLH